MTYKKYGSIILAYIMFFCGLSAFQSVTVKAETESENNLAYALEIVSVGNESKAVTRSEVAGIILRLMGNTIPGAYSDEDNIFSDVAPNNENADAIIAAYKLGLLNGTSETTFGPNESVTYEQMSKIMVDILGYKNNALAKGGYPTGYVATATSLGIDKSVTISDYSKLTKQELSEIVSNVLEIELAQFSYISANGQEIDRGENKTIASSVFHLTKYNGVVTATPTKRLTYYSSFLEEGTVQINDVTYQVGDSNICDFAGYKVDFYVDSTDDIIKFAKRNKYKEIEIDPSLVSDVQINRSFIQLSYYKSKTSSATASIKLYYDKSKVIYNGICTDMTLIKEALFYFTEGNIKAIDYNNDGTYEFLFIDHYNTAVVKEYSQETSIIRFEYSVNVNNIKKSMLDLDDFDTITVKDGYDITTLQPHDVLLFYIPMNDMFQDKYIEIIHSGKSVSGVVSDKNHKDDIYSAVLDGTSYDFAADFVASKTNIDEVLKLGVEYTFYLNSNNQIAYTDNLLDNDRVYGYLTFATLSSDDDAGLMKIFAQDGKFYTFELTSHVEIYENGVRVGKKSGSDVVKGMLDTNNKFISENSQLIRFRPDKYTKINLIEFAPNAVEESARSQFTKDNLFVKTTDKLNGHYYMYSSIVYDGNTPIFPLPSSTVCFFIPNDITDTKSFSIGSFGGASGDFTLEAFGQDEVGVPKTVVCYAKKDIYAAFTIASDYSVIKDINYYMNDDGDLCARVNAFTIGKAQEYNAIDSDKVFYDKITGEPLKIGDIVQMGTSENGYIKFVDAIFTGDTSSPNGYGYTYSDPRNHIKDKTGGVVATGGYDSERQIASGQLVDKSDSYIKLLGSNGSTMVFFVNSGVRVTNVWTKTKTVDIGSKDDLKIGDFVVLRLYLSQAMQISRYID